MQIDIDEELIKQPLSKREKLAIWILLILFNFIAPAKYSHQTAVFCKEIKDLIQ